MSEHDARWIEERPTIWTRVRSAWTMWRLRHVRAEIHHAPTTLVSRKVLEEPNE